MPSETMGTERNSCTTRRFWAYSLRHYPDTGIRPTFKFRLRKHAALMLRRIILLAALGSTLLTLLGACSRDSASVDGFRALVQSRVEATESSSEPYFNEHHQKWAKRRFRVADLKFDVRKTDSLVSPLLASVKFTLSSAQTQLLLDKEEARTNVEYDSKPNLFKIELIYAYQDGHWRMTGGRGSVPEAPNSSFELSEEKIRTEPNSIPNAALLFWLK